jgi:hypothetical protein
MHPTRIFKTPEQLHAKWEEYKEFLKIDARNWPKIQYVGKDGNRVEDYPVLPFTLEGFCVWHYKTHDQFIHQYFKNKDECYTDFVPICSYIKEEIRAQQITGGMLGQFNPSITQRLNGLTEKVQNEQNININKMPDWLKAPIPNEVQS